MIEPNERLVVPASRDAQSCRRNTVTVVHGQVEGPRSERGLEAGVLVLQLGVALFPDDVGGVRGSTATIYLWCHDGVKRHQEVQIKSEELP